MRSFGIVLTSAIFLASVSPAFGYTHARRGPTAPSLFKRRSASKPRTIGPRAMDSQRAGEIQTALIKSGYLSGTPSGHWDAASESAMQKLQGDNGWQTKLTPDSRALILLGLGPKVEVQTDAKAEVVTPSSVSAQSNPSFGTLTSQR
jgi:hypothetical protein